MTLALDLKLEKKIKKNIYGKPQTAKAVFPSGFGDIALAEINQILSQLWFQQKYTSDCELLPNEIRINNIHISAMTEILMRSQCLADLRLIIYEGKAFGKYIFEKKCREIDWNFYLNQQMSIKIHVNSIASKAFHETGLKEILSQVLQDQVKEIVSGDESDSAACIYVTLFKNKLSISISLAGAPLYKRGYRGELSASAPLREDAAACSLKKALQFKPTFKPDCLLVPFSGTGTFAIEYLIMHNAFAPVLFKREYALQKMNFFKQENFNYLVKKALTFSPVVQPAIINMDTSSEANTALLSNVKNLFQNLNVPSANELPLQMLQADFLETDFNNLLPANQNIFLPLNPPYGIRLGKQADPVIFYKNIANKINQLAKSQKNILGFILCPSEETWLIFTKTLNCQDKSTYHFNQGGLDIRVCQFYF